MKCKILASLVTLKFETLPSLWGAAKVLGVKPEAKLFLPSFEPCLGSTMSEISITQTFQLQKPVNQSVSSLPPTPLEGLS